MIRVCMVPHPSSVGNTDGLSRVVENYGRYLPQLGVEFVSQDQSYDILAAHAGVCRDKTDVSHLHGLWWTGDGQNARDFFHGNAQIVESLRVAKEVIVPSTWVAETIARDMRFMPNVVPHGIDCDVWAHSEQPLGYVLWNKNRKSDVCDPQAVTWLAARRPQTIFVSTFATPDAPSNVKTTGVVSHAEMKRLVQSASIYLSTTKETFGIGILEAMASGVPVLSVARGNALNLIEHKVTGYLAQSWEDMLEGMTYCLEHRDEMGRAAMKAARMWSWENACAQVMEIYERALRPHDSVVTVVIPCYNYASKVGRAINSVKSQTWTKWECIVVNDGSTDDSGDAIQASIAGDNRFRYVQLENSGVAIARNTGMAVGSGKYGCCMDADDQMDPEFLSTCVDALERDTLLGIAYTGITTVKPDGTMEYSSNWPKGFDTTKQFSGRNQVPTCCVFRIDAWRRIGGQRQRYAPGGAGEEDAEGWVRMNSIGFDARQVTSKGLFIYSYLSGRVSGKRTHPMTNYLAWHPWVNDQRYPLACIAEPKNHISHPVYQYDEPKVSVVIPVGPGHGQIVVDALDSVEAQTFREWEVIVVNDTGGNLDLEAYPYVRIVNTVGRKGAGYARNRGIETARAKAFVCLDADDILQPTYLQDTFDALGKNPESWIYPSMYIVHSDGKIEDYHSKNWNAHNLWNGGVSAVTCLYTTQMWKDAGGFDEEHNREDWDFHLRLVMAGYCGVKLDKLLFTYRHATGQRRGSGAADNILSWISSKYSYDEVERMCTWCKKPKNTKKGQVVEPPVNWDSKDSLGWPQLEYIGKNANDLTFNGRTRRRYIFGNSDQRRFGHVHPDDVRHLLKFNCFRMVNKQPQEELVAQPTLPPITMPIPTDATRQMFEPIPTDVTEPILDASPGRPEYAYLDVNELKIKDLRDKEYNIEEWNVLLAQEQARDKPRSTVIDMIQKQINRLGVLA